MIEELGSVYRNDRENPTTVVGDVCNGDADEDDDDGGDGVNKMGGVRVRGRVRGDRVKDKEEVVGGARGDEVADDECKGVDGGVTDE